MMCGVRPSAGCRCRECVAARRRIHAALSPAQRHALEVIDLRIPRHPLDLRNRDGVRSQTLDVLAMRTATRPPLVHRIALRSWPLNSEHIPFILLTQDGAEVLDAVAQLERKVA